VKASRLRQGYDGQGKDGGPKQERNYIMKKTNILALALRPAMRVTKFHLGAIFVMVLVVGLAESATAQSTVTQVIGGLHSPRGLAFGPGGQLYVAQSGDETVDGSIIEILNPMSVHPNVRTIVSDLPAIGGGGSLPASMGSRSLGTA
jgi:hypothetical protein